MKFNKIILSVLAAAAVFSAQSCLKDQKDIFPQSSSERLQAYMDEVRQTLTSESAGWIMSYYPGSGQALGGYAYHIVFTADEATVACELDPAGTYTSLYKLTADNGAVLSFDVNNPAMHYFATPSSSEYQAKGGDFEFTITSVSSEKIGLKGKRSGNHYDMYPYKDNMKVADYMAAVADMSESLAAAVIEGKVGDKDVKGSVDLNHRRLTFSWEATVDSTAVVELPYMYTPNGLRGYKTVEVAGQEFESFVYDADNNTLSSGSVVFKGKLPEDYTKYSDFEGDFVLAMYNGSRKFNVTLTPTADKKGYVMSGLSDKFTVNMGYDKALGRLTWNAQVVGTEGNITVWLAAWSLGAGGNLTWSTDYGVTIYRDVNQTGVFNIEDNGKTDLAIDSFILWGTNAAGASQGQFTGWGTSQYPYLETFTRK